MTKKGYSDEFPAVVLAYMEYQRIHIGSVILGGIAGRGGLYRHIDQGGRLVGVRLRFPGALDRAFRNHHRCHNHLLGNAGAPHLCRLAADCIRLELCGYRLFVFGAAVMSGTLQVTPNFFRFHFPAMLLLLYSFRIFVSMNRDGCFKRVQGAWILGVYVAYLLLQYRYAAIG